MKEGKKQKCSICLEHKPLNAFYVNTSRKTGHHSRCIDCDKNRDRKQYMREYMKKNYSLQKHKWQARKLARKFINKEPCVVCGADKSEAHHPDHSKPLEVIWLCHKHHFEVERKVIKITPTI